MLGSWDLLPWQELPGGGGGGGRALKQLWDAGWSREGKSLRPALLLLPWHDLWELAKQVVLGGPDSASPAEGGGGVGVELRAVT